MCISFIAITPSPDSTWGVIRGFRREFNLHLLYRPVQPTKVPFEGETVTKREVTVGSGLWLVISDLGVNGAGEFFANEQPPVTNHWVSIQPPPTTVSPS